MTVLSCAQDAASALGIDSPTSLFSGTDPGNGQLRAFAQKTVDSLRRNNGWQALRKEYTFKNNFINPDLKPSDVSILGPVPLPEDFDRIIPTTFWNLDRRFQMGQPLSAEAWAALRAGIMVTVYPQFRILDNAIHILPQTAPEMYRFEYASKYAVVSQNGIRKERFTLDTDSIYGIPENLLTLGMVWLWKREKGLEYAEALEDYERALAAYGGNDAGLKVVDTAWAVRNLGDDGTVTIPWFGPGTT